MNKKIHLLALISICIIVLANSTSAVEYSVLKDHRTTMIELKIKKIFTTLEKSIVFFENIKDDLHGFKSTQDRKKISEKINNLQTTLENITFRFSGLELLLLLFMGLIITVIIAIFVGGATLGIVIGSFISILMIILVSLAILLINIISSNVVHRNNL